MRKILPLIAIISTLGVVYAQTKDPLYQSKGDQKRTYTFPGTTEQIPYHLFVPSKCTPTTRLPLIVILHGNGVSADTPFTRQNLAAIREGLVALEPDRPAPLPGPTNCL